MKKINIGNTFRAVAKGALLLAFVLNLAFINSGAMIANAQGYTVPTGDVDNGTYNSTTCYYFTYDMRKGSKDVNTNGEVSKLQEALVQLGYMSADPTGYFGNTTYNAVRSFQSAKGLLSSGFVGSYTRAALQSATCNTPNPYPTPTPVTNINLTPSSLDTYVYDQDSTGNSILGLNFTDSNSTLNFNSNLNTSVSIINTNISNVSASLSCYLNTGAIYSYVSTYCGNGTNGVFVSLKNSNMSDNTYYYFTIRINQNGSYTDKQYSFTYKKRYTYNPIPTNTCTYGYINGAYGCYYNVTCNSSYDYARGYYINNCQYYNGYNYNNNNNGNCVYSYQNGVYGCWYDTNNTTLSPCVVGAYPNNCGGGYQNGTNIIY